MSREYLEEDELAREGQVQSASSRQRWLSRAGSPAQASGEEIGDLCAWASNSTNITLGSHFYAVQPLWSNASSSCVTSF